MAPPTGVTPTPQALGDELREFTAKIGEDNSTVEIQRQPPGKTQWFHVTSVPVRAFDPDSLAKTYGGGNYKYTFRGPNGQFMRHAERAYDPDLKPQPDAVAKEEGKPAAPGLDLAMFMQIQQQNQLQMANMFQGMMSALAQALGNRPAGPSMTEIIGAVKGIHDMAAPAKTGSPFQDMKAVFDVIERVDSLRGDAAGGGEPTGMLVRQVVRELINARTAQQGQAPALPAVSAAPAAPAPAPAAPAAAAAAPGASPAPAPAAAAAAPRVVRPEVVAPYPTVRALILQYGPQLLLAIRSGTAAAAVADNLMEQVPENDPLDLELEKFVADAEAADLMYRTFPPLEAHVGWCKDFVVALKQHYAAGVTS